MTEPLRILHVHSGNLYGGVESQLVARAAMREECPELQSSFALCFEGRLSEKLGAAGVGIHQFGLVRFRLPWTIWQARRRLASLLARSSFDAVLCHNCWSLALFAQTIKRCGLPLVYWAHDIPNGEHWLERRARRNPPNLILANSRATLASMPLLFPATLARLQPAFIRPRQAGDAESIRQRLRTELMTSMNVVVILMTCRMEPLKGHRVLFDALTRLTDIPEWRCWIAGGTQRRSDRDYVNELTEQILTAGLENRVRLLGQRDDVADLMMAADIYCQPNIEPESFGLTFIEAMQAGLPVVTSALGGANELLDDQCGRLPPPGDCAALARTLADLIRDEPLRSSLGVAGKSRAAAHSDAATAIRVLYEHVVAVRRVCASRLDA